MGRQSVGLLESRKNVRTRHGDDFLPLFAILVDDLPDPNPLAARLSANFLAEVVER